jgi:hypothetical protein
MLSSEFVAASPVMLLLIFLARQTGGFRLTFGWQARNG